MCTQKTCIQIFTTALFTRAKNQKYPGCRPSGEWRNKMYIPTMAYYSVLGKNKVLTQAAKWMNLKNIVQLPQNTTH